MKINFYSGLIVMCMQLRFEPLIQVEARVMKESGNDEAFDQELTRLLLSFMMEEPLVTPNDSDHLSW